MGFRRRGIGDWIPTSGEGRALVEVKGRVGKMRGGRSSGTRGLRRAMRSGRYVRKSPKWFYPVAPGDNGSSGTVNYNFQKQLYYDLTGTLQSGGSNGASVGWLFALTPEVFDRSNTPFAGMAGDRDTTADRLRIVGMTGNLFFTPLNPIIDEPADSMPPSAFTGTLITAWFKFTQAHSSLTGGISRGYPWGQFTPADASSAGATATFVPSLGVPLLDSLSSLDYRERAHLMHVKHQRWRIPHVIAGTVTDGFITSYMPQSIQVPLPRKVIANVGKGEALAMMYYIRDDGTINGTAGSPAARFSFESMRIKCFETD